MPQISLSEKAPDFLLADVYGKEIRLSNYHGQYVILALLRGFA